MCSTAINNQFEIGNSKLHDSDVENDHLEACELMGLPEKDIGT